jgi:hypothetical protein
VLMEIPLVMSPLQGYRSGHLSLKPAGTCLRLLSVQGH